MVGKAKPATPNEKYRMSLIGEQYFGCIPCRLENPFLHVIATVQHVTSGNKRLGHRYTYGCCSWHHFGHDPKRVGPSLANGLRPYQAHYGSEILLVNLQDQLIAFYNSEPWFEYDMPIEWARHIYRMWVTLRADDPNYQRV
jgi:hypothetical protein